MFLTLFYALSCSSKLPRSCSKKLFREAAHRSFSLSFATHVDVPRSFQEPAPRSRPEKISGICSSRCPTGCAQLPSQMQFQALLLMLLYACSCAPELPSGRSEKIPKAVSGDIPEAVRSSSPRKHPLKMLPEAVPGDVPDRVPEAVPSSCPRQLSQDVVPSS